MRLATYIFILLLGYAESSAQVVRPEMVGKDHSYLTERWGQAPIRSEGDYDVAVYDVSGSDGPSQIGFILINGRIITALELLDGYADKPSADIAFSDHVNRLRQAHGEPSIKHTILSFSPHAAWQLGPDLYEVIYMPSRLDDDTRLMHFYSTRFGMISYVLLLKSDSFER